MLWKRARHTTDQLMPLRISGRIGSLPEYSGGLCNLKNQSRQSSSDIPLVEDEAGTLLVQDNRQQ
jgi:hypothetical protein